MAFCVRSVSSLRHNCSRVVGFSGQLELRVAPSSPVPTVRDPVAPPLAPFSICFPRIHRFERPNFPACVSSSIPLSVCSQCVSTVTALGLLRESRRYIHGLCVSPSLLAPKKKTVGGGAGPSQSSSAASGADHVFNIYKTIPQDHQIMPDENYPQWLWTLTEKPKSYGQLAMQFLYGQGIEDATVHDFARFCRLHRKNKIKLNNMRLKKSKRNSLKPLFWDA